MTQPKLETIFSGRNVCCLSTQESPCFSCGECQYKIVPISALTNFRVIKHLYIPKKEFDGNGFYDTATVPIMLSKREWLGLFSELKLLK